MAHLWLAESLRKLVGSDLLATDDLNHDMSYLCFKQNGLQTVLMANSDKFARNRLPGDVITRNELAPDHIIP